MKLSLANNKHAEPNCNELIKQLLGGFSDIKK